MKRISLGPAVVFAFAIILASQSTILAQALQRRNPPDYSKEAFVVERLLNEIHFENDGTYDQLTSVRVSIQSPAGVQAWGLIRFPYASSAGNVEFTSVKVTKPDGTVVATTQDNIQDMPAQITVAAPFYSDLKEKQLAVRGLAVGDTLEYEQVYRVRTPLVPGQFWYAHDFFQGGIVLSDELKVRMPAGRAVKIKSPRVQPTTSEAPGYRTYDWKTANLVNAKTDNADKVPAATEARVPDVQLSSFATWAEVADWYAKLQEPRIAPTTDIRAKAEELTKNAATDSDKIQALYDYVALKFRYVGIAFGIGRYQPHSASDVLTNGYGDCKDKHTLLAALLSSVGINSYPALMNSEAKIDGDVPSPGQFNHVVTVVQQGVNLVWLDTTPEVAPFGLLLPQLRDKDALIVTGRPAQLVKSPVNPPFRSRFTFRMTGKISDDGTLAADADVAIRGDVEVSVRSAFRNTPQPQWKDVVQLFSQAWNFGGTVNDVTVSSPEATGEPVALNYTYQRKNYPRWPDGIGMPLPPVNIAQLPEELSKISEPLILDAPGDFTLAATIELPKGMAPRLRPAVDIKKDFAEYHAAYTVESNLLHAERRLAILMRDVPKSRIEEYRAFWKAVDDDEDTVLSLVSAAPGNATPSAQPLGNSSVATQLDLGDVLLYQEDYDGAAAQYRKVLQQEPDNFRAHYNLGKALYYKQDYDAALKEYRDAVRLRATDAEAHSSMGSALLMKNDLNGAVSEYRESLRLKPDDASVHSNLADTLSRQRRWDEAIVEYREALRVDPKDASAHRGLGEALAGKGDLNGSLSEYRESVRLDPNSPEAHRQLGYALYGSRDYDGAISELRSAVRLDPKNMSTQLWLGYSFYAKRDFDAAIAAYQEVVRVEPNEANALGGIGDALYAKSDFDGAISQFRAAARLNPDKPETVRATTLRAASAFMASKRFPEAAAELQPVVDKNPQDAPVLLAFGFAQVQSGKPNEGLAALEKALTISHTPGALNHVAYELADGNALLDDALRYGIEAVREEETETAGIDIRLLDVDDLRLMPSLASYWDTLGWVYFRQGKMAEAEQFLTSAWRLMQAPLLGNHLGQLYEKIGKTQQAINSYALALALPGAAAAPSPSRDRLVTLAGSAAKADQAVRTALGELSDQRTVQLPRVARGAAKAEFFVLFDSSAGASAVRFISGSEELRNAGDALIAAHYDVTFPSDRSAKIVRRGILDCPATGPNCHFILLPPESVTSAN
jgi:tetratricopeptide (TPR) repeat protein